ETLCCFAPLLAQGAGWQRAQDEAVLGIPLQDRERRVPDSRMRRLQDPPEGAHGTRLLAAERHVATRFFHEMRGHGRARMIPCARTCDKPVLTGESVRTPGLPLRSKGTRRQGPCP